MLDRVKRLRQDVKIALLGSGSVLITALALVLLAVWQSGRYNALARAEMQELIDADLNHIALGIFNLVHTENEAAQAEVDRSLAVARHVLERSGSVRLDRETVVWEATDQFTGAKSRVVLPLMSIGSRPLRENDDPAIEAAVVDEVTRLVGETATIFQRMNERGDMLRVATTVLTDGKRRVIGTYIPAMNPDGTANPVVATVLRGGTYHGRALVVDDWHLTAYDPIRDQRGGLVGMLYVGVQQRKIEDRVRQAILQTRVGKTGYVFVVAGRGEERGRYVVSQSGARDGENIWETRDSDGQAIIQKIIAKAIALPPGQLATVRYRWQNPNETAPRWKVVRLSYFEPWDWVIGTSAYEDELLTIRRPLDSGRRRMSLVMSLAGAAIALLIAFCGILVAWTITRPIKQMTRAVEKIIQGDLNQRVSVDSDDEISALAQAFNVMTLRLSQTLEGLRKNEQFLGDIIENIPHMVFVKDAVSLRFVRFNRAGEELTGFSRQELLGKGDHDFFAPDEADSFVARDREALQSKRQIDVAEEVLHNRRGEERILHTKKIPILDGAGHPQFLLGLSEDITERKRAEAERQKLEAQLIQAQKIESIGTMASGIAHDFNNILTIILNSVYLLADELSDRQKTVQRIQMITQATERGVQLVRHLLTFARQTDLQPKSVQLNELIREVGILLETVFPKTIEIHQELFSELPVVTADPGQLHQVLVNMCVNSRDAMPGGGRLTIATATVSGDALRRRYPLASAEQYVQVSVRDTGTGMDEETKRRIFDPFFTTKGPNQGTGLGLAVVYGVIKNHGGLIDLDSAPGRGTEFRIFLPVAHAVVEASAASGSPDSFVASRGETILLVEDERMSREIARDFLRSRGFQVLTAADGLEGMAVFAEHAAGIDLVVTDLGLPKCAGDELCRHLRQQAAQLPLVVVSGYISQEKRAALLAIGVDRIVAKPYRLKELLGEIRTLLGYPP